MKQSLHYNYAQNQEDIYLNSIKTLSFLEEELKKMLFTLKDKELTHDPLYTKVLLLIQDVKTLLREWRQDNFIDLVLLYTDEFNLIKSKVSFLLLFNTSSDENSNVVSLDEYKRWLAFLKSRDFSHDEKNEQGVRRKKLLKAFYTSSSWSFLSLSDQEKVKNRVNAIMSIPQWEIWSNDDNNYRRDVMSLKHSKIPDIFLNKELPPWYALWIKNFLSDPRVNRYEKAQVSHDLRKIYGTQSLNDAIFLWKDEYIDVFSPEFDFFRIINTTPHNIVKNKWWKIEVLVRKKWENRTIKKVYFAHLYQFVRWTKVDLCDENWEICDKLFLIDFKKSLNQKNPKKEEKKWLFSNIRWKINSFFKNIF